MANPRRSNGHRRDQVVARVKREESDCWLCGEPVDKTLPPFLDGSPEIDEVVPVSLGGSPFDRRNCRLAHRLCNIRRGNGRRKRKPPPQPVASARRWW